MFCLSHTVLGTVLSVWIQSSGTLSRLMQPAPVFKGCWVPSPALSGSHKGLSSVGWEGMTLEDFGSVCLCVYAAGSPLRAHSHLWMGLRVRRVCTPVRMPVFAYDYMCSVARRCACTRVFSSVFSHSGTLPSERCASQSAEREKEWERERGKQDLKQTVVLEMGQRQERKQSVNDRQGRMQGSGAGVRSVLLWTLFQMFVHCKYRKHYIAGTSRIRLTFS